MLWVRFLILAFFSFSAISLLSFQSIEIIHAFMNFIQDKHQLK